MNWFSRKPPKDDEPTKVEILSLMLELSKKTTELAQIVATHEARMGILEKGANKC